MAGFAASAVATLALLAGLTGCGSAPVEIKAEPGSAAVSITGKVHGGQQPITQAAIQLYAVGTTGDASAATPLLTTPVMTDSSGAFSITNDYTCPSATSQVYLVSTGGNPGLAAGTINMAESMMAALGSCANLIANPGTYVFVDEVTTIGSVYALAPYMNSYATVGSGTADATTFDALFTTVNEYANTTNGTAPGPALPAGYDASTAKLYTLADIVAICINSAGGHAGDGTPCGNLFLYATPPAGSGVAAPADTVQAVLDIAKYPNNDVASLYALAPSSGPYLPTVPVAPSDWTLPILPELTVSVPSALVGIGNTLTGSFTLAQAAPAGGLTVTVTSSQTPFVSVTQPVLVAGGATSGTFTYTGVAPGTSVLSLSAPGYVGSTASVTATYSLVTLGTIPTLAPGQTVSLPLSLGTAAPAGGTTVNFTSLNPSVATVFPATVFISAGLTVPTANPQITGVGIGSTTINGTATGYAPNNATATVTVTASLSPGSITEPLGLPTSLTLSISAPAPAGGIAFKLTTDNAGVATVSATPFVIAAGSTSVMIPVTGVAAGQTTLRADSPGIVESTATIYVASGISVNSVVTGNQMQSTTNVSLAEAPPSATTVVVTSNNPAVALLSTSVSTVGTASLTFTNVISSGLPTIYVQGESVGATTLTVTATGYTTNSSATVTVYPSGFSFSPYQGTITTTTFSTATAFSVYPTILNPGTLTYYGEGTLNPGIGPFNVAVTSSTPATGTIVTSPVTIPAVSSSVSTSFQPVAGGSTTITLGAQPAGFSTPAQYLSFGATVTAPSISVGAGITGNQMQNTINANLGTSPLTPTTVTVTSGTPGAVLLSTTAGTVGTSSLTFTNITSTGLPTIYVQGESVGSSLITVSAPGYTSGTSTVTVYPSGFSFSPYQGTINTTTFSTATSFSVYPVVLTPGTLNYYSGGTLNPGVGPFNLAVTSSTPATGTITTSPVTLTAGSTSATTSFQPVAAGSTTITLGAQPAGFSTPAQLLSFGATVTAPGINVGSVVTGNQMQASISAGLGTSPLVPITVTVTSGTPGAVLLSTSTTAVGTSSLTFTNVTSTGLPTIYVQGESVGSSLITVTAPGYNNGTATVTVYPSGFSFSPYQGTITTTTFSTATSFGVYPVILSPTTLTYYNGGTLNPGVGPFSLAVTSSSSPVGTITTSPVVLTAGSTSANTSFQPVGGGTATITLGAQPAGFSTPTQYVSFSASVTAPTTGVSNVTTGNLMQATAQAGLAVTPPSPITVTVTTNGPGIATISTSPSVVGGTSLTFNNVTSTGLPTIYVQGQSVGTTTLTLSAPGYQNSTGTVTVLPSGFSFSPYQGTITTTTFSSANSIGVYPVVLNAGTLTYNSGGTLNPGVGPFSLAVTSSSPSVGTISTSPVTLAADSTQALTNFQPVGAGNTTITLGAQPAGFSTPSQYVSFGAVVTAPPTSINSATTGVSMQTNLGANLGVAPQTPVTVTITSSNPGAVLLSNSTTTVGSATLTFTNVTGGIPTIYAQGEAVGSSTLTLTAAGYTGSTATVTVLPSGFVISPYQGNINTTTLSTPSTVTLVAAILNPGVLTFNNFGTLNPGVGPFNVPLTSTLTTVGTVTSPVTFAALGTSQTSTFTPIGAGTTTLTVGAQPAGFSTPSQYQSITAAVTAPTINVGNVTTGAFMQTTLSPSLGTALMVPVTVTVTSSNMGVVRLSTSASAVGSGSLTFTNVTTSSIPTVYVQGQAVGSAVVTVSATGGYTTNTGTVTVFPSGFVFSPYQGNITTTTLSAASGLTLVPAILNPGILTFNNFGTLNPGVGPFSVPLTSSSTAVGTIATSPVTFMAGSSSAADSFQPVGSGTTTLTVGAQPPGFTQSSQYQTLTATVSAANINVGNATTGVLMQSTIGVGLGATPLAPTTVIVTSNNPSVVTLSTSATTTGLSSLTFTNITSTSIPTIYVQGQTLGNTTITVTAAGYNNGTGTVTVLPSGFVFSPYQGNISVPTGSAPSGLTLVPAVLNPGVLTFNNFGQLNPNIGPFNLSVTTASTAVGSIGTSPVVFHGGDSQDTTSFVPAGAGSTTISIGAQPAGFSTPSQYLTLSAMVYTPSTATAINGVTTGVFTQVPTAVSLAQTPTGPITVTVTSNNPAIATVSLSAGAVGTGSVTFTGVTSTSVGTVYVQGQAQGSTTLTVTATGGFTSSTGTVTVDPSGFALNTGNINTTTFSSATGISITPVILAPGVLTFYNYAQLNPGVGPFNLDLTSSNVAVGTITTSPVIFNAGSTGTTSSFQPVGAGTTNLTLGAQPPGFSTPSAAQYTQITATVTAPNSTINGTTTGVNMQAPTYVNLGAVPESAISVTITTGSPAVATLSTSPTTVGTTSVTFTGVTSSSVGPIYVQGQSTGNATLTVTAPGYNNGSATVTVDPSGFIINTGNIVTNINAGPTSVQLTPAVLTPGLLTFYGYGQLNPGIGPFSLALTSSMTGVGTVSTSPVVFHATDSSDSTTFVPVATGTTNLTLGAQPAGFSTPSQAQLTQITATVVDPNSTSVSSTVTGVNLQSSVSVGLGTAPSAPVSVTITSSNPGVATLSLSATAVGTASVTIPNVSGTYAGQIFVQGQAAGSATLTVTATGYTSGTGTVTVDPSGFLINSGNINTSLANPGMVTVVPAILNPGVLTLYAYGQLNPGVGPYSVGLISSNTAIGTVTSPLTFNADDSSHTATFQPVGAGTAMVTLGAQPAGFSTPSQYQSITATVSGPSINVGNVVTGVNLENPLVGITLSVAPTSPITVTVTTNGAAIATVSNSSTVVGTNTITFTNVTSTNVGTVWVQGQSLGTTTLTVSAPGYTSGLGLATVDPSGFVLETGNFATLHTSPSTVIPIYTAVLDPSTLAYVGSGQLNPGLGPISIAFTSSNPAAGTILMSPVAFNGGDASENATFQPAAIGTTNLTLGTPPAGFSTPSQAATQTIIVTVN